MHPSLDTGSPLLADCLDIRYAATVDEARYWVACGYEPVECSFGGVSVVGDWVLDHHGPYAHEEAVSIKAARIALSPGFLPRKQWVVTGMPDSDAVYAILVLSGIIRPSLDIALALAILDIDPIGIDRTDPAFLREVAFQMTGPKSNSLSGYLEACMVGVAVFDCDPLPPEVMSAAIAWEASRIQCAQQSVLKNTGQVVLVSSSEASRDVWHTIAPLLVQFKPHQRVITFSGCSVEAATRIGTSSVFDLLGPSGLHSLYPALSTLLGGECGGRADIGGSPRGMEVSLANAEACFELVRSHLEGCSQ